MTLKRATAVCVTVLMCAVVPAEDSPQYPSEARTVYERALKNEDAGKIADALADYEKAGELAPHWFDAHFGLSSLLANQDKHAKAIAALGKALQARPGSYSALFNLSYYYEVLRQYDKAILGYGEAVADDVDFSHHGDSPDECRAHAYHYRGRIYQWHKKNPAMAIADFTKALQLDPKIRMVHYRRGRAYHDLKDYEHAHQDFEAALAADPDYHQLNDVFAWQLATCPDERFRDGPRAVELASRHGFNQSLAAAYAETGKFDEAVDLIEKWIDKIKKSKRTTSEKVAKQREQNLAKLEQQLAVYRAGKPFREP